MVESGFLLRSCTVKSCTESSNLSLSAIFKHLPALTGRQFFAQLVVTSALQDFLRFVRFVSALQQLCITFVRFLQLLIADVTFFRG